MSFSSAINLITSPTATMLSMARRPILLSLQKSMCTKPSTDDSDLNISFNERTKVRTIMIDRPSRFNALNHSLYKKIPLALKEANSDWPNTKVTVLAGNPGSPWYSSGNDLTDFLAHFGTASDMKVASKQMAEVLENYVAAFIDFGPGLLVASVHGPATGIPVTTLPLCDGAYAADSVRFTTPFTRLAQAPEGCSTLSFQHNMGYKAAMDILAFDGTVTAQEAKLRGIVTDVFPERTFHKEFWRKVERIASLPPEAMEAARNSVRAHYKKALQNYPKVKKLLPDMLLLWVS